MNEISEKPAQSDAPKWQRARSFLLNAALVAGVFLVGTAFTTRNMLSGDGAPAPALVGPTLSGELYLLEDAASKPVLVYFFAPWCKICGAAADNLARLRRWRDPEDLEIVAVALDWASAGDVRAYAERHELNVPVVLANLDTARDWQISGFPSYYVLDADHRIARRDFGYSSQFGLWWRTLGLDSTQ